MNGRRPVNPPVRVSWNVIRNLKLCKVICPSMQFYLGRKVNILKPFTIEELKRNWESWEGEVPYVTVICTTFNNEDTVAKALDGILSQVTKFPFKVLIHDDASKDRTTDIVREYQEAYPDILETIFQEKNVFSQEIMLDDYISPFVIGEFVAFCEGDDYWICENKLQDQVVYLETNTEHRFVGSFCEAIPENTANSTYLIPRPQDREDGYISAIQTSDLMKMFTYIHTSTYLMRIGAYREKVQDYRKFVVSNDLVYLSVVSRSSTALPIINRVTSIYRLHDSGMWSSSERSERYKRYANTWSEIRRVSYYRSEFNHAAIANVNFEYFSFLVSLYSGKFKIRSLKSVSAKSLFLGTLWRVIRKMRGS